MARINVLGHVLEGDDDLILLRNYHAAWRETNSLTGTGFFSLFEGFKDRKFLATLDGGALRLYLYFGFVARNAYGDSWYSIETIAKYFGKQKRTVDNWIKELVDAGLIYRARDDKQSNTTFLIPFNDTLIKQKPNGKHENDDQEMFDDLISVIQKQEKFCGPIVAVFHVFHWGITRMKKPSHKIPASNYIFAITRRSDGVLVGHTYLLKNSSEMGISQLLLKETSVFQSPFVYQDKPITGIAVKHTYRLKLKESYGTWLNLLRDLDKANEDILAQHPRLEYGSIDQVLVVDEDDDLASEATEEDDEK